MSQDLQSLVAGVEARTGHSEREPISRGTRATLRALGSQLGGVPPVLHDAIPTDLHADIETGAQDEPIALPQLYDRVAAETGLRVGLALEVAQSVMAELSAWLSEPARGKLREQLQPEWSALVLEPRPRSRPPAAAAAGEEGRGHSLATGRPGSARPLADSPPPGAQADSIAASDDPHADRLATASGPGPRRSDSTLADGRPGSHHSVADSD